jgi:hypothetical protein
MYFSRNWEFGSVLSKLRNLGGGSDEPSNPTPQYATGFDPPTTVEVWNNADFASAKASTIPYSLKCCSLVRILVSSVMNVQGSGY